MSAYAGADWLRCQLPEGTVISPLGVKVADLLGELWYGLYHWREYRRVDWTNPVYIKAHVARDLATYDSSDLTRLVFLAHRHAVRVTVEPCNFHYLRLLFHERCADGKDWYHWHPTLAQAVEAFDRDLRPWDVRQEQAAAAGRGDMSTTTTLATMQAHHLDVEAVCITCHRQRERARV